MKIEAGRYYRTRSGKKMFVAGVRLPNPFDGRRGKWPVLGFIEGSDSGDQWTDDGHYYPDNDCHDLDLVAEWRDPIKIDGWINVYPFSGGTRLGDKVWPSKSDAEAGAVGEPIATVYVTGTEGVGP